MELLFDLPARVAEDPCVQLSALEARVGHIARLRGGGVVARPRDAQTVTAAAVYQAFSAGTR